MNIAFTGWAGSGKTSAAKYLENHYFYKRLSFADGIKEIAKKYFFVEGKDRKIYQQIGEHGRDICSNVWVNYTIRRMNYFNKYVIDDLRRMNEYETLKERGFYIVRIVADEDIRIKRLRERDGSCDETLLYNESENGCKDLVLPEIVNTGNMDDFYKQLDNLMIKIDMDVIK